MLTTIVGTFLLPALLLAGSAAPPPPEKTVASKRTKELIITIINADGRLKSGENRFCAVFQRAETKEFLDLQSVSVEFTLLVGRIQEKPIRTQLVRDRMGHFCGDVNLGKQYYVPATYHVFVLSTDADGKKRKERLSLSIR